MTAKHNEFIEDYDKFIHYILQHVDIAHHNKVNNINTDLKNKWKKIFTKKKEETIDETINNERNRISILYDKLKNGIYDQQDININININMNMSTLPEVIEKIRSIMKYEKKMKGHLNEIQYLKGSILSRLKTLTITKKSFEKALKNIMSYAHARKLISFYNTCEKYHNLRFTTLPFNKIYSNLHSLEDFMKTELQFWNPPQQTV